MENLGECSVRAIKVMQESIRDVVLSPGEPLGIFLDARLEEKDGMVVGHLDLDSCLDRIKIIAGEFLEISLAEPSCQRGAVGHQEGTVPPIEAACQQVDPWRDDRCNIFQKVV